METKTHSVRPAACAAVTLLALIPHARAVNGAQPGGHGAANSSMGGAAIALPLDAEAAANNPAGLAFVPSSMVLGLQLFDGRSSSEYVEPGNRLSNHATTAAPEGGIDWRLPSGWTTGVSLDVGGAGANYKQPALPVPGASNAKSSLEVVEIIPALAWQPRDDLAFGAGLNIAAERFEAQGVIVPAPVPGGLLALPDHGPQHATGVGLRAGVLWKAGAGVSLGLNAKSRTHMGALSGYGSDLLAYSGGHLDVPSEYGVGAAWQATPALTFAADWLRVDWGELGVMKDPNGFRWRNQPIGRLGVAWRLDDSFTLRAGYSHSRRQITSDRTAQNLLVPSINDQAFTAGIGWKLDTGTLNVGYEFDPRTTLQGDGPSLGTSLTSKVQMLLASYQINF